MRGLRHRVALLLFLFLSGFLSGVGAQELVVNGNPVGERVAFSVADTSYAAAAPLAQAIGASFAYDDSSGRALFQLGGRVASLRVYSDAAQAAADRSALQVEGREAAGLGGVWRDGVVYVQVRGLAAAFGGSVTAVPEADAVAVFLPRAELSRVSQPEVSSDFDRILLEFSGDVPVSVREEEGEVYIRFGRARVGRAGFLNGSYFAGAAYYSLGEDAELRLSLGRGVSYELLELPQAQGVNVVIDVFPAAEAPPPGAQSRRVVLDPAPQGGEDVLALARRVAALLARRGVQVSLTRDEGSTLPLEARMTQGIGADLFLSLSLSPLPEGRFALYYLDEADSDESLLLAVRRNAEDRLGSTTDETRRRLLLGLVRDLSYGRSAAATLAAALRPGAGLEPLSVGGAPLFVLGGAAGRGLLLELGVEGAEDERLADALAAGLAAILADAPR